jgi:polyisoprenoid-binding protein YceI
MEYSNTMRHGPFPKAIQIIAIVAVIIVLLVAGGTLFIWVSGGTAQPSTGVSAPSVPVSGTAKLFRIVTESSEARFLINETLLGQPKTVVGSTNEVAGDIAVDFDNPANTRIGVIRINVRTLKTDNEIRNRTLRGQVLQANSPELEFATFVPKQLIGLPDRINEGQPFTFQIVGDLTVHGATRPVTFEATVTPVSRSRVEGTARATISYEDFNINIPTAPGVADVADQVRLEIDFVALPVSS